MRRYRYEIFSDFIQEYVIFPTVFAFVTTVASLTVFLLGIEAWWIINVTFVAYIATTIWWILCLVCIIADKWLYNTDYDEESDIYE